MATITTRSGKGAALTHTEMDNNFTNLNTDKVETNLMPATAGTQEASKIVQADANVNTGVSKITELHIGPSGSETQVTATAAELNKLDGVASSATELDQRALNFSITLGTADDQHIVIPFTGNVTTIYSVIDRALTTANETLTFKNNAGTSMTDGVITITQAGSADGDIDSTSPSANRSFTAGQKMTVSIGGENGTAVVCNLTVLFDIT